MHRVLIVEDEPLELNALCAILSSQCPKIRQVQGCGDGDAVWELLETFTPDIILMDVHLGNVDGIDLSQAILDKLPSVRIIVLTAFNQFTYAQKALHYGLADYLLKPVSTPALLASLSRQREYLERIQQELLAQIRRQQHLSKLQDSFLSSFVGNVICDNINPGARDILALSDLPTASMQVFIIALETGDYEVSSLEAATLKKLVVDSLLPKASALCVLADFLATAQIVLCTFSDRADEAREARMLSHIQQAISQDFHLSYRVSVGAPVSCVSSLPLEYKRALGALQLTDSPLCSYHDLFSVEEVSFPAAEFIDALTNALISMEEKQLGGRLEELQKTVCASSADFPEAQSNYITVWVETMQEIKVRLSLNSRFFSDASLKPVADMIAAGNLSHLHECCKIHFSHILKKLKEELEEKNNYTVLRTQRYIDAHYKEPLTLQSISKALHISPYYLCHIFKENTDSSVMEYLNTSRINAAKELLKTESGSVKDIAFETGFSDPNYFCRVFKRVTGITPSAFRRLDT